MSWQTPGSGWCQCPGCGRERGLAPGGAVMCGHTRWDFAAWAMVPCEGSGRRPHPRDLPGTAAPRALAVPGARPAGDGRGRAA